MEADPKARRSEKVRKYILRVWEGCTRNHLCLVTNKEKRERERERKKKERYSVMYIITTYLNNCEKTCCVFKNYGTVVCHVVDT